MTIADKILRAKADYDEVFEAGKMSVESSVRFTEVESTSYRTTAPNNVLPFAKVNKIGGMTHKTRNLIPFPYNTDSKTEKGITFAINENGIVTINGTATEDGNFYFINPWAVNPNYISVNGTYTLSGISGGGATTYYLQIYVDGSNKGVVYTNPLTFTASGTVNQFSFFYKVGAVFNNFVISPMLNEGTTALPYEPYFEGIRNAEVTELKSDFGNLFNYDNIIDKFKGTGENEGKIVIKDAAYSMNIYTGAGGSSTRVPREYWNKLMFLTKGTYYAYFDIDFYEDEVAEADRYLNARAVHLNGEDYWCGQGGQKLYSGGTFTMYQDGYCYLRTVINKRCYISNLMITRTPRDTYIPYKYESIPIPEAIKSLDGYGLGVNSEYYNHIDFDRKVFVQNVYRKVFDGTEYISKGTNGVGATRFIASTDFAANNASNVVNVVCNHYTPSTIYETNDYAESRLGASASAIRWVDAELLNGTEEEMKAKLKAWYDEGNPLIVDYILAEPIETDISAYLTDEYIEVEGGGTVTVVNEYGLDAPTTISYIGEI